MNSKKVTFLVMLGNILEYYDFLLFAHLGFIITPLFFPNLSSKQTHILSLFLFGSSFVVRPIGGFIFGRISDFLGRKDALVQATKWAILPALLLAILPGYESIGIIATYLFVLLRLLQGVALGGEYPAAGTYLMEYYSENKGLVSGLLAASGTIGSLMGFGLAFLCLQEGTPTWLWRGAFFLGALGGFYSYYMRKSLVDLNLVGTPQRKSSDTRMYKGKITLVIGIGVLVGLSVWLPMTYSNFYVTKILGMPLNDGLMATFIALVGYIILTPIFGHISDRFSHYSFMMVLAFMIVPVSFISFALLLEGYIIPAQIGLILCAASFGAPIHVVMNSLFPKENRGRYISLLFMMGLSLGGIAPSIAGYIVDKTDFHLTPAVFVSVTALIMGVLFYKMKEVGLKSQEIMQKAA